jgi:hypothetical protein
MPNSNNKHAINLYNGIEKHIGRAEAETFIKALPLSKSADHVKKFKWANGVCAWLEERFSEDEICKIRMECSCNPGGKAEKTKKLYEVSSDLTDFCERFNKEYAPGNVLSYDGAALYFTYPTCYCSCVNRGNGLLTNAWCVCSLGYIEKLFAHAMSHEVQVELIESVMMGGEKCVIRVS